MSLKAPRAAHAQRALRSVLRALWFALIPLLLSGVAMRHVVPHSTTATGLEGALAALARAHALWLALCLFLLLAALTRYWRNWLPGGRYLSTLPDELVGRVPRSRLAIAESACALLAALDRGAVAEWSAERRAALHAARSELTELLSAGKWSKLPAAYRRLAPLAPAPSSALEIKRTLAFLLLLCAVAGLALQLRTRIVRVYDVNGNSMLPSLTPGQVLLGDLAAYRGRLPERGDVVVIDALVDGKRGELIKRVIGLPGDRIEMYGVHPVINGWTVPTCDVGAYYSPDDLTARAGNPGGHLAMEYLEGEAYLTFQAAAPEPFTEYVVKPDEVFVLGDNRNNSRDSRAFDHGAAQGFARKDVRAKITRVLFGRTRSGEFDPALALRALGAHAALEGVDMTEVAGHISGCLALRPKIARAPSRAFSSLL